MSNQEILKDIDDKLQRLEDRIVREFGKKIDDHETRLRANESFRWKLIGAMSILSFAATYIWDWLKGSI